MLDFDAGREAVRRDLEAMVSRLEALPEDAWSTATRCAGWSIRDLIDHVASVADAQAEAFEHMLAGSTETPAVLEDAGRAPNEALAALRSARDRLVGALEKITPEQHDDLVPLPFATLPCSIGIVIPLIEYGTHRNDLEWALGDDTPMAPDVAATVLESLPAFLPSLETVPSDDALAYTLAAPSARVSVVCRDGSWSVGEPNGAPMCTIEGDDSAVALFALGRIGADHPSVQVSGETAAAGRFKQHFPGP